MPFIYMVISLPQLFSLIGEYWKCFLRRYIINKSLTTTDLICEDRGVCHSLLTAKSSAVAVSPLKLIAVPLPRWSFCYRACDHWKDIAPNSSSETTESLPLVQIWMMIFLMPRWFSIIFWAESQTMIFGSFLSFLLTSLISKSPTTSINYDTGSASIRVVTGWFQWAPQK